jgi:hypothetical protein
VTQAGRSVKMPDRFVDFAMVGSVNFYNVLAKDEDDDEDVALVGAGLGGGFQHTSELQSFKFKEVLAHPTKSKVFAKSVVAEYNKMKKFQVFEPVLKTDIPVGSKILSSTWVIKQKASGDVRGRLVARGYEQIDGVHYDSSSKAAPVIIDMTIRIVLILCCLARWRADVEDVVGAFLNGEFEANLPPIYMKVPQGFEQFYDGHKFVLRVKKTIYGTIQAAMCFWCVLTKAFSNMGYTRCVADPCLHFKWTDAELSLFASHVDDNLILLLAATTMSSWQNVCCKTS